MQADMIRIGTRGSPLALAQAREVKDRLAAAHGLPEERFEIVVIKTTGDRVLDRPLADIGGKGLFTKEIEEALLAGEVGLAVHSMKDMATLMPDGLAIGAVLAREDPRDAFISVKHGSFADLPDGAVVGTSSLRRQAQVKRLRPDLTVVGFRGNVETRLKKLADGAADATFLAVAGLKRLGAADRIAAVMEPERMLPAVTQGVIAVQIRSNDQATAALVALLNDAPTATCAGIERAFLARLEGSCRTPIAGLARIADGSVTFAGMILSPDGATVHETWRTAPPAEAAGMGTESANDLLARAGPEFLRALV